MIVTFWNFWRTVPKIFAEKEPRKIYEEPSYLFFKVTIQAKTDFGAKLGITFIIINVIPNFAPKSVFAS